VGGDPRNAGVILRGDASRLDVLAFDGPSLRGVWGTGPNDVWVAPYQGEIQHWNGASWTRAAALTGAGTLVGIGGVGPKDVWAVGLQGLILHFDGRVWSQPMSGTADVLWSVWGSAPDDVWTVGNGAVLHWNGSVWFR
jgi:hypothetical protein